MRTRRPTEPARRPAPGAGDDSRGDARSSIRANLALGPDRFTIASAMPARLSKSRREQFLSGRRVAVLTTIGSDGAPCATPIWYFYRDGLFYFRTAGDAIKT